MNADLNLAKSIYFTAIDGVASFPDVMTAIREAIADPAATPASVGRSVERDVAFASRLLRIVNSPAAGLIRPCSSLPHAIALVGLQRIGMHAETVASLTALQGCAAVAPDIAARAATEAALARAIATSAGVSPERAFTAALLAHVGTVAILVTQPHWSSEPARTPVEERERLGFDHAELGADILRRWNLPDPIPSAVARRHDLEGARADGAEVQRLVAIVQAAAELAPLVGTEPTAEEWAELAAHPAMSLLALDGASLAAAVRDVERDDSSDPRLSGVPLEAASSPRPSPEQNKRLYVALAAAVAIPAAIGVALFTGAITLPIH